MRYDAIVVGARCAGAPTAMLLARKGYTVLLLDRSRFPSDTLSSHYIHQSGIADLHRWGILDQLRQTDVQAIERVSLSYEDEGVRISGQSPAVEGQRTTYGPRRHVLDSILVDAARDGGVHVCEGSRVHKLLTADGRVKGVTYRASSGSSVDAEAAVVIGADGMRSTIAHLVAAPLLVSDPLSTCAYYSYWEDLPAHFELFASPGGWVGTVPTNGKQTLVMTYLPQSEFPTARRASVEAYESVLARTSRSLWDRMASAKRVDKLYGTGDQRNFFRQPYGPGWVLVGDALHHKDSITARGISDAFRQAELLAEHIGDALGRIDLLDAGLLEYAAAVEREFMDRYRATLNVAQLRVEPSQIQLLRAISGSQDLIDRYFGTLSGACSLEDFYNDALLEVLDHA